jgi:hypothetical protein
LLGLAAKALLRRTGLLTELAAGQRGQLLNGMHGVGAAAARAGCGLLISGHAAIVRAPPPLRKIISVLPFRGAMTMAGQFGI